MQNYARYLHATERKKEAKRLEAYVRDNLSASSRLNPMANVVDLRQLLREQKH